MNLKKIALFFFACVAVSIVYVSRHSSTRVQDQNTLIVGTSPDYPPYEYIDIKTGEIVGFDIDVVREIGNRLGKNIIIKSRSFVSLIFGLMAGEIDVIASAMTSTSRRSKFVLFTQNYIQGDPFVAIVRKNSGFKLSSIDDLVGKKVAVNSGYTAESFVAEHNITDIIRLTTPAQALIAVQAGSVDAFVCALSTAQSILNATNLQNVLTLQQISQHSDGYAYALHKKSVALTNSINAVIVQMQQDGTLDQLKKRWKLL